MTVRCNKRDANLREGELVLLTRQTERIINQRHILDLEEELAKGRRLTTKLIIWLVFVIVLGVGCIYGAAQAGERTPCQARSEWARDVMVTRQFDGAPVEAIYADARGDKVLQAIVIAAYKLPRYQSRGFREIAIDEFANATFIKCVENSNGK